MKPAGSITFQEQGAKPGSIKRYEVQCAKSTSASDAACGDRLLRDLSAMIPKYEMLRDVRGKGMMIGIEFGAPRDRKSVV